MKLRWLVLGLAACGGKAVIDPPVDDEGSGGAGATGATTTDGVATTNGPTTAVTTTSGPVDACTEACRDLYRCGLEVDASGQALCPGFDGSAAQEDTFLYATGSGGCVDACNELPALLGLIDPTQCEQTIFNLKGASAGFAEVCEAGF